jgi:hypothetical protein
MRKPLCLLFVLFLLISCGPSGGDPATDNPETTATQISIDTETAVAPAVPEPTTAPVLTADATAVAQDEYLATYSPATSVAEAAVVREQDWVRGASEPLITVIEYGDFQ